eukprot:gb/GFBE01012166.1/.p1 GENE.gb/GFBE01012166.1/~~gb/GFBE01012166.1/.p1  ORF type:complete len:592 (+),score=128.02 gb/GFBE01012166.1/:1-1776(+)
MSQQTQDGANDYVEGRLLDGFLLLAAGGSSTPEGVVTVNLSSLQIVDVAEEDLAFFGHLDRLDVSDNQLGYEHILEQLGRVPRLSTLNLACNYISSLQVQPNILAHLEVLDLSFNGLHGDVLSQLARLPSLVTLNLSSNCISSVPQEEELGGLQALEELILDANDLVQFIQWRALDALPRLKKLSLISNRVKRLKDDAPDTASGSMVSYFPSLEELDLSSNEITGCHCLPVVQLFQSLKCIRLSDNPTGGTALHIPGVQIIAQDSKPFYMKGNGCFQKAEKSAQPKLKLDRRRLRKVDDGKVSSWPPQRTVSQLGYLDEEANQLLVKMSGELIADVQSKGQGRASSAPASTAMVSAAPQGGSEGILDDDLSEEELDQIFRERRATIEARFEAPIEEPQSFMRQPEEAGTKDKLSQLVRMMRQQQDEESGTSPAQSPTSPKATPSSLFLTGIGEDGSDAVTSVRKSRVAKAASRERSTPSPSAHSARSAQPVSPEPEASPAAAFQALLSAGRPGSGPSANAGGVMLPPILNSEKRQASTVSLGSVATGSPQLPDLRSANAGSKSKTGMADAGVREAIRALRAATMSEYAVAA